MRRRHGLVLGLVVIAVIGLSPLGVWKYQNHIRKRALVAKVAAEVVAKVVAERANGDQELVAQRRAAALMTYEKTIKPLFAEKCYSCHGISKQAGGVRVDTVHSMNGPRDGNSILVPGRAEVSLLLSVLRGDDGVSRMPLDGTPLTAEEIAAVAGWIDAGSPAPDREAGMDPPAQHWAFNSVQTVDVPHPKGGSKVGSPIDSLISEVQIIAGIQRVPPAEKSILLRRLYIDLVGIPPTPEELQEFLEAKSPVVYESVVDRLLESPQYGERWGRHWMDVWRYSETDGRKALKEIYWSDPLIWRWRDWIVDSLNRDKGYDRMILEMLAGDELPDASPETWIGTGFLVRSRYHRDRHVWLNNVVEHTAKAFMGLTLNCARCHDHKFDPLTHKEYYQFRHFFQGHDVLTEDVVLPGQTQKVSIARVIESRQREKTYILRRGEPGDPVTGTVIACAVPAILARCVPLQDGAGRRIRLARWLVDSRHPLTARVAVNHVWQRHFGEPLVGSMYDFGTRTKSGVHQKLLDWLAHDLQSHNWSMKRLHRLIVTSSTYRLSSSVRTAGTAARENDPNNRLYWRMNSRRMESEAIRDSLLHLSGSLDSTLGGEPIPIDNELDSNRRSLYFRYSRDDKLAMLTVFDAASVDECYRRSEAIIPQQALALANSEFVWRHARKITEQLSADKISAQHFVLLTFKVFVVRADFILPAWSVSQCWPVAQRGGR